MPGLRKGVFRTPVLLPGSVTSSPKVCGKGVRVCEGSPCAWGSREFYTTRPLRILQAVSSFLLTTIPPLPAALPKITVARAVPPKRSLSLLGLEFVISLGDLGSTVGSPGLFSSLAGVTLLWFSKQKRKSSLQLLYLIRFIGRARTQEEKLKQKTTKQTYWLGKPGGESEDRNVIFPSWLWSQKQKDAKSMKQT